MFLEIEPSDLDSAASFLEDNGVVAFWANSYEKEDLSKFGYPRQLDFNLMRVMAKFRQDSLFIFIPNVADWSLCHVKFFKGKINNLDGKEDDIRQILKL